jgi:2-methylisocitrate lyase-like PEP mutase family enzyme
MPIEDVAAGRAARLRELHLAPQILVLVNVWDAITARVVADLPGTAALATASHSIAAAAGYPDGEVITLDEMVAAIARIVAATDLPVSADLEAGYGDPGETVRRAIGVGVVGANLEDRMVPLADAVRAVEAAMAAGEAEGVPFVLNARTDAFLLAGARPVADVIAEAIERGRAFLAAGATSVFVPGKLDEPTVRALVEALGPQRLSLIAVPGGLSVAEMASLGVARVSTGPWSQRIALTALAEAATGLMQGGTIPAVTRVLT